MVQGLSHGLQRLGIIVQIKLGDGVEKAIVSGPVKCVWASGARANNCTGMRNYGIVVFVRKSNQGMVLKSTCFGAGVVFVGL